MDKSDFNSRDLAERMHLVILHAEYLNSIDRDGYVIKLYTYDYNYISVYQNMHTHIVEKITLLHPKDSRLNLFAVAVNLSDLFKKENE